MFDKDLNSYLRTANRALPCGAARTAFARYVNEVAQDVLRNDPGADFAAVTEQLGPTVIAVLAAIAVFFIATKGVRVVNTDTTYTDWGDQEYTQEELDELTNQLIQQSQKEHEENKNT